MISKQDLVYYLEDLRTLEQELQDEYRDLVEELAPGPVRTHLAGLVRAERQHVLFVNRMIDLVREDIAEEGNAKHAAPLWARLFPSRRGGTGART